MVTRSNIAAFLFVGFVSVALVPTAARAQSAIAGVVKDTSGGILPGVTVEVTSDALIEKTRSVVTDGAGQYKIINLRPGTYAVTFTLTGFQSVRRENLALPGEFTATVNADLRVGAVAETITVVAEAPTVDVQSAAHVQLLDRDALDNIPTGRTIQGIGQIIVGVNLNLPDVGGSRAAMQTYMSVRGQSAANNTVMVDGMMVNGLELNGAVQSYFNDAMNAEMAYQTSGIGADVSSGGVKLNMIPKEGGNRFSGSTGISYRPGQWQGDNLSDRLKTAGLTAGNSTAYISDFTLAEGGPIVKDKVWFFATGRDYRTSNRIANTFYDDGTQGDDYNYIRDGLGRVTWQASSRHKLAVYYDRVSKYRAHDMQSNYDPETASNAWTSPNYSTGSVKWTSPVTNRLLVEAGYAFNVEYRNVEYQPGVEQAPFTDAWFANASRTQTGTLGVRTTAAPSAGKEWPRRSSYGASASYVTGSHNFKFGVNGTTGAFYHETHANGDLTEQFSDAALTIPVSVIVRNTPVASEEVVSLDMGIYAMDTWTLKRLTLNAGVRGEWFRAGLTAYTVPAGRFVPARSAPERTDIPNWKDLAPRFQMAYDVFGDGKTAVKLSINRYNAGETTAVVSGFNPLRSTTSATALAWTDLNGDKVAQGQRAWDAGGTVRTDCVYLTPGCEINLAQLPANFGLLSDTGTYGGYPRSWTLETGLEVQHELMPRLSVTGTWYQGSYRNLTSTVNRAVTPADYTAVQIFNPNDGTPITIYNISAAANGRASDNITFVDPDRKRMYNSFSGEFRARPGRGALIFGGVSFERERTVNCAVGRQQNPNYLRFCDQTSLPEGQGIPFRPSVRVSVTYPLSWQGIIVSGTFQSNDGGSQAMTYGITGAGAARTRYPDGSANYLAEGIPVPACPAPCPAGTTLPALTLASFGTEVTSQLPLVPTGSVRNERLNQVDLKFAKTFKIGGTTLAPSFEVFNINNSDKVITYVSTSYALAGGSYLRPNSILQGRIIGVSLQARW